MKLRPQRVQGQIRRSLIHVPAQTSHGITAAADSRLVILFVKSPGSTASVLSEEK